MFDSIVHISRITNADDIYAAICTLSDYLFNQTLNRPDLLKSLSDKYSKSGIVIIASIEDEIKGLCVFYDNDIENKIAFLSMIVVSKDAQGIGIGNALLKKALNQCKCSGMEKLRLEVANANTSAIQFYRNRGFVRERENKETSYYICAI